MINISALIVRTWAFIILVLIDSLINISALMVRTWAFNILVLIDSLINISALIVRTWAFNLAAKPFWNFRNPMSIYIKRSDYTVGYSHDKWGEKVKPLDIKRRVKHILTCCPLYFVILSLRSLHNFSFWSLLLNFILFFVIFSILYILHKNFSSQFSKGFNQINCTKTWRRRGTMLKFCGSRGVNSGLSPSLNPPPTTKEREIHRGKLL